MPKASYEHEYEPRFDPPPATERYHQFIPDDEYVSQQPKFQALNLEPNLRRTR